MQLCMYLTFKKYVRLPKGHDHRARHFKYHTRAGAMARCSKALACKCEYPS